MTTQISRDNIQAATLGGFGGPKISLVQVTNSSYTNLDDTAVDLTGGFVKLIGSGFAAGCQVLVGLTPATSVTFISETEVRAQLPATAAGTYIVYLINSDGGTAIRVNGVTFSGTPAWLSNSTLAGEADTALSIQLTASGAATFALADGSTLPPGVTLSSSGLLSGTITGISQETVYNFTINAVDAELQDSPRAFAFTVTSGDALFAQTTLLLPGSANTFVRDASTNNATVTVFGDTRANNFNPHLTGWSNFFDGNREINTASSSELALGTDNFTIEFFIYPLAYSDGVVINWTNGTQGNTGQPFVGFNTSGFNYFYNGSSTVATSSVLSPLNSWTHVAMSRSAGTLRIFINGQLTAFASDSTNITFTTLTIGSMRLGTSSYASKINGFLSNLRIVKGTAVYTAAFTPPTVPLTAVAGTSLLTCQSNRFRDASTNNLALTPTGDVAVRTFSPFLEPQTTNGSGYFDGTGDYLRTPLNAVNIRTAFTIEAWVNVTTTAGFALFSASNTAGAAGSNLYLNIASGTVFLGDSTVDIIGFSASSLLPLNIWNHIAVTFDGTTYRVFVNGTLAGSSTTQLQNNTLNSIDIGARLSSSLFTTGYISNFRVVKGTAVYTANFTPPAAPLTAVAGTGLLTLQSNQPHNNNQFLDSSTENLLITRSGNTTQGSFSPYSPSGWSNYFDGAGDSLSIPSSVAFAFDTSNFTIEAWVYTSIPADTTKVLIDFRSSLSQNFLLGFFGPRMYAQGGTDVTGSLTFSPNTWNHCAWVRNNGTLTLYLNGVSNGSVASTNSQSNAQVTIGGPFNSSVNQFMLGYISNLRVVRGSALYTANFTPSTQPLTAIPGTSLLTCCDNRFIDDSPNNFAITRNGDARVTNFSPFRATTQTPQTYSAYFDGSGDNLTTPAAAQLLFGTNDFTIEFWAYHNTVVDSVYIGDISQATGVGSWAVSNLSGLEGTRKLYFTAGSLDLTVSAPITIVPNTWYHIAVTRSGSSARLFINGTQLGSTFSFSRSITTGSGSIAIGSTTNNQWFMNGYISNVRVVNGTALYTANFTPPTAQLTAVSGTSLLTCQSPTFVDNSTNRFAITAAGNSQPSMVNPFGSTFANSAGYSAAAHGGSMYFDGTNDYLTVPDNTALQMGTGSFTIEFWINFASTTGFQTPYDKGYTGAGGLLFQTGNGNGRFVIYAAGTAVITESGTAPTGTWIHYALVRNASTLTLYRDGVSSGSATNSTNFNNSSQLGIGANAVAPAGGSIGMYAINGYLSNVRVVKGTAIYTGNFVPPLAPVQPVPGTTLLLNGTSAAVTDVTTKNVLETVGDVRISSAVSRFGGSSMFFDGTGDRLIVPSSPNFDFPGNFTIEMWINFTNVTSTWEAIISRAYAITGGWRLYKNDGTNQLSWWSVAAQVVSTTGSPLTNNTWSHVAVVRNSGTITIYIDGVNRGSAANTTNYNPGNYALEIGEGVVTSSFPFEGYIQDLRITNGVARYTSNFTPPTAAFQTK